MVRIKCKQFFLNPVFLLAMAGYLYWMVKGMSPIFHDLVIGNGYGVGAGIEGLRYIPLSFVFFILLSYAFLVLSKNDKVRETVLAAPHGMLHDLMAGMLPVVLLNLLVTAGFFLFYIEEVRIGLSGLTFSLASYGARCYLFHFFLMNLFGILLGTLLSFVKSEICAYGLLVGLICMFSEFFVPVFYRLFGGTQARNHMVDLFGFTSRMFYAGEDYDYMISAENVELERMLFWIFLTLGMILLQMLHKSEKRAGVLSLVLSAFFLCLYMQPSGASHTNTDRVHDQTSGQSAQAYYERRKDQTASDERRLIYSEDFHIQRYEGTLDIHRLLKGDVKVYVDQTDLDTYAFSLRHEYRIKKILSDKGEPLPFTQNGDWVTVETKGADRSEYFEFLYQGYSSGDGGLCYYSTAQSIRLPGCYAYLPFSGKRYLYVALTAYDEAEGRDMIYESGAAATDLGYEAEYDIRIKTPLSVYSNLKESGKNHLQGRATGVTLFANPFVKEVKVDALRVLCSDPNGVRGKTMKTEDWAEREGKKFSGYGFKQGTVFFISAPLNGFQAGNYYAADHVFLELFPEREEYDYAKEHGNAYGYHKQLLVKNMEK